MTGRVEPAIPGAIQNNFPESKETTGMNDISKGLYTAARVLMAVIFLVAGLRKVLAYTATAGYFGSLGIPLPEVVLALTIVLEVGGAIALAAGWRAGWIALALGVFCIASGLLGHRFWAVDPAQFANQLNHFMKNVAMAGGLLLIHAVEAARQRERA
jgi:putative oxidoreductase